jgi:hypothetical protein
MNDPFDIYIEDLFNVSLEEMLQRHIASLQDLLIQDPDSYATVMGVDPKRVKLVSDLLKANPPDIRAALSSSITLTRLEEVDSELGEMRKILQPKLQTIIALLQNSGVFCATRNHDNLLMWAHYPQQHRGVVLGFRPDVERDSFFRLLKPVRYTDTRPTFYEAIDNFNATDVAPTENEVSELVDTLILSKSTHWSYEEELRIVDPHGVPPEQSASFLNFYPNELCEMYLGCRADLAFRSEIMAAARKLNSDVAIFDSRPGKASYALAFERVG